MAVKSAIAKAIFEKAKAGYPAIYLQTSEDMRVQREIKEAAAELKRELFVYTYGKGLEKVGSKAQPIDGSESPPGALTLMRDVGKSEDGKHVKAIVILRLFHEFLEDPLVKSKLLDLIPEYKITNRMLIITAPTVKLPPEIEKEFALIECPLPDKEQIGLVLDGIIEGSELTGDKVPNAQRRKELIEAAMGMTTSEADNALALSAVKPKLNNDPNSWDPAIVMAEKCSSLKKTGLLDYIPVDKEGLKQIGGLDLLKAWVGRRRHAFGDKARAFGLPAPKGILMVGPPGSGKSLSAKAISGELQLPLLRLDMGKMFGSLVGQSEANMRQALMIAEAVSPCILWIDEIEKGLAGSTGGSLDSGVGARVLGTILTWMVEKSSDVFVYATANDVTGLPPELLRKGRFDEMFSVTLPNESERAEIFEIHLRKKNRWKLVEDKKINMQSLVHESKGYSGSEIEACIIEGLYTAFDAGRELTQGDIVHAMSDSVPLSTTMKDKLAKLEEWCKTRTRPASTVVYAAEIKGGRKVEAN